MLYHSVDTLGINGDLYFIAREEHLLKYKFLEKFLLDLGGDIIVCYNETRGAAESLLLSKGQIKDNSKPMISVNSDQYMNWNSKPFVEELNRNPNTSYIVTFNNNDPKCSYVRIENGKVSEVREKKVISNIATVGIYHWKTTEDFYIDAEEMIRRDIRDNNEFYVAPVYNLSIERGLDVNVFNIGKTEFLPVGTPNDLIKFKTEETFID
jgi:dTDP-glucose pyrophosphorylase